MRQATVPCSRAKLAAWFRRHRWLPPRCAPGVDRTSGAHLRRSRTSLSSCADDVQEVAWRNRTSQSPGRRKWWFRECLRTRLNFTALLAQRPAPSAHFDCTLDTAYRHRHNRTRLHRPTACPCDPRRPIVLRRTLGKQSVRSRLQSSANR
jgi:hypothetical protein